MAALQLASQPDRHVQVGVVLQPSIVLYLWVVKDSHDKQFFAQAIMTETRGRVPEHGLAGEKTVSGVYAGSTAEADGFIFTFDHLSFLYQGEYEIRLDVYEMARNGAHLVHSVCTSTIRASGS